MSISLFANRAARGSTFGDVALNLNSEIRMLLMHESRIDRITSSRRTYMVNGLALVAIACALPRGWGCGVFSGFMLFSLGIYGLAFQKWRTDPGLWMLAAFLTIALGSIAAFFEYGHWQGVFAPPDANQVPRVVGWHERLSSVDAAIALLILARTVRFAATVVVENWKRTRVINRLKKGSFRPGD